MAFPENDDQFEDVKIDRVEGDRERGYSVHREDGWVFLVSGDSPVAPQPGMTARLYGKGLGYRFRGVFLDGRQVFYRTEAEDQEHFDIELYGADAADWLARWDAGRGVWSISMGGLGPSYEQAIQITVVEIVRNMLVAQYDAATWDDTETWRADLAAIDKAVLPVVEPLGLSGAQWGAAVNLAATLYRRGPRAVMHDERVKDRHIQVSRDMPSLAKSEAA